MGAFTPAILFARSFHTNSAILVDSTRRGKRFPDALSKSVPIWCAVLNKAAVRLAILSEGPYTKLATPVDAVSRSEHDQIEQRIAQWAEALIVGVRVPLCYYQFFKFTIVRLLRTTLETYSNSLPNL